MLYSVIMAGGSGTRFWPASRRSYPKQLLPIGGWRPLVEETMDRISELTPPERILIVTNSGYAKMTSDLLPEIPYANIIGEPVGRDTAACIGLAACIIVKRDPDGIMAVMPSDHIITPHAKFLNSLEAAASLLDNRKKALLTFGIKPSYPSTGYGYIKRGASLETINKVPFHEVDSFREKPNLETARTFVEDGGYYWNAGIFIWRADTILDYMAEFLPQLHEQLMRIKPEVDKPGFQEMLETVYPELQKISIDFGVMEKADDRIVAEVEYEWDDVGSWDALARLVTPDENGNSVQGDFSAIYAKNNIVSAKGGMVGLIGVEGLVVVHTPDATLVCRKEDVESVKKLVDQLEDDYK